MDDDEDAWIGTAGIWDIGMFALILLFLVASLLHIIACDGNDACLETV